LGLNGGTSAFGQYLPSRDARQCPLSTFADVQQRSEIDKSGLSLSRLLKLQQTCIAASEPEYNMNKNELAELTADIVAAHVSNNSVAVNDLPSLITQVHAALSSLEKGVAEAPQVKSPVVSVRASVKPDYIVCMECGRQQKTLKRHLQTAHAMTPGEYRRDYGLPDTYPMTAPNYSEQRKTLAKAAGLGRKRNPEAQPSKAKRKQSVKG
jgi:predicted transcriptional regulator